MDFFFHIRAIRGQKNLRALDFDIRTFQSAIRNPQSAIRAFGIPSRVSASRQ
jgi:hypothetical protein